MRTRMALGIISLLAVRTVGAADAPITSNPIPEPIVKRGLPSRSRISCACPIRAGFGPPIRTLRRTPGRA